MDSIRVLVVGSNNKATGGIPRYIPEQLEHLPDGVDASVYDIGAPEGSGTVWFLLSLLLAVLDAVRFPFVNRPDVVHVHTSQRFSFYRAAFYALYATYIWRCPVILHIHGSTFDEFVATDSTLSRRIQSLVYRAVDEVIVLSEYWKSQLGRYVDGRKITVIPNAVDPEEYDPSFETEPAHVVFVSNLIPRKGVAEFATAVETVMAQHPDDVRVTIAGKGPLSDRMERLANEYENVEYLGYVSEERKRELLSKGSIYVLPSYAEGLPIALLEAMAGGNALVSSSVGSIPEVVRQENGVLVKPSDADELAAAISQLVESPETVERMAKTNRELALEQYSWSSVRKQLRESYIRNVSA